MITTVQWLNKMFAFALAASLAFAPIAFAQEAVPSEAPDEAPDAEVTADMSIESVVGEGGVLSSFDGDLESLSIIAAEEQWQKDNEAVQEAPPAPLETGAGIQATFNTQEVVDATTLESTANPESSPSAEGETVPVVPADEATSSAETIPLVLGASTSTEESAAESSTTKSILEQAMGDEGDEEELPAMFIAGAASLEVIDGDITEGEVVEPESIDVITVIEPEPIAQSVVAEVEAEPSPEFSFALTGKQIPAKKTHTTPEGFSRGDEDVDAPLVPMIDNETGAMHIAGQCSDVYFVVLLFKDEDDYAKDPRSYILNQAFPCENGQFSYSISELPYTLASGTYYLLVGQQGNRGAWTPITSLTEITINHN